MVRGMNVFGNFCKSIIIPTGECRGNSNTLYTFDCSLFVCFLFACLMVGWLVGLKKIRASEILRAR